jgi:phospholipase A1
MGVLLSPSMLFGQSELTKDSVESILRGTPAFSIYKDNYFITGMPMNQRATEDNSDVKIQFSFKQRIQNKPLIWGSYFYLIYTQKSFWDIYKQSSPFAETNYNPGLQLNKPLFKSNKYIGTLTFSFEHESNGRDSIYSRSWNFMALSYRRFFSDKTNGSLKLILPVERSDNPDLNKYIGYAEAQFEWDIRKDLLILDVLARKGASWDAKGGFMATLSYRPSVKRNIYWTLQWWQGYAENLVDYRKNTSMLRIGFMVKPTFLRFY